MAPIFIFFISACSTTNNELLVFAAASLREALVPMAVEFERETGVPVHINFNGSVTLSQQLLKGAPGDIFIAAGAGPFDLLEREGFVSPGDRSILLTNQLVLIVPISTNLKFPTIYEILVTSNRVAIADPKLAPAGQYSSEALKHLNLWDDLTSKILLAPDVRAALAYVETGSAETGLVYRTDALVSSKVTIVEVIPTSSHSPIVYPIATLARSDKKYAAARFISFLQQELNSNQFEDLGFGIPASP